MTMSTEPSPPPRPGRRTRPTPWRLACFAWLGLGLGMLARAETLLVGPDGAQQRLEDALRMARDGDVIEVLPGNYLSLIHI